MTRAATKRTTADRDRAPELRALLYTRVSKDKSGRGRSPEEQDTDLHREAAALRWHVVDVVSDIKGASRHTKGSPRAGWPLVLRRLAAGDIDVLMVWESSRLTRTMREFLDFADLCEHTGTRVHYNGRTWDLADPYDRAKVMDDMVRNELEVEVLRKRIMRNTAASLEAGRPAGRLMFGYQRVYDKRTGELLTNEPDEVTGPVVAEVYRRFTRGESIRSLCADLDRRGVKPMGGGRWAIVSLRRVLSNPSYLGHRTSAGRVVVENAWPPLVDETTFYRAQAILTDPARRMSKDVQVKHLLVGLLHCETCGSRVTYRYSRARNAHHYRCKGRGCVAVDARRVEEGVRELVAARLARPDALAVFATSAVDVTGVSAELKALTARLEDSQEAYENGEVSPQAHGRLERKLTPRIAECERLLAVAHRDVPVAVADLAAVTVEEVRARWDALDLLTKRAVVRALLVGAELRAAPAGRRRPDLGLRFRWGGVGDVVEV